MELDPDSCFAALSARDPRFDGLFFVGVASTGVYCRPVCPARTPRRDRCRFFASPVEAERAGFRACFRCRPELAPGRGAVDAVPQLVRRAVRLVDEGWLERRSVEELSDRLGVTARHLRRAMKDELGVSPLALARSRRLGLAKRLLQDTALPLGDVALASGFPSVRRFNAAFRQTFGRTPSSVRRDPRAPEGLVLRLDYRGPFDWDALLGFLGPRAVPGLETVDGGAWRRTIRLGAHTGTVTVRPDPRRDALVAEVPVELRPVLLELTARLRARFDLDARPAAIGELLSRDPALAPLVARRPGLRVPGPLDRFEVAVRAVLGQQVSVRAATTLAARLCGDGPFPTAAELAVRPLSTLAAIGLPGRRAETLWALARRFADGRDDLEDLPGVGPWTRAYVALRCGDPDVFPAGDLALRRALGGIPAAEAARRAEAWRPWRSYAALHLWTSLGDPR